MFKFVLIGEVRKENAMSRGELAELLDISPSYLGKLEKGSQEPGRALICRLADVTKIPVERWFSDEQQSGEEDFSSQMENHTRIIAELKSRLKQEHRARQIAEEQKWELAQEKEYLLADIRLRDHFDGIRCSSSLSKNERMERLKILAAYTLEEDILCFDDIQRILKIERPTLRNWLDVQKREFECRYADDGKIMASSPGEAGLCLRCFDCRAFESGECLGHGDEKQPETILELLEKLRANGVYDCSEQAQILEKYYDITLSARKISDIRYRARNHLTIPDDILYLDIKNG